jgi:hypothetical protein
VTEQGLEDQLLTLVVRKERADLAEQRATLIEQDNEFKIKMVELEDQILYKLATAEGDISEDVELIEGMKRQPINTYPLFIKILLILLTPIINNLLTPNNVELMYRTGGLEAGVK